MDESYLSHHGILGQKWGIRRYQNPDGSLTDAGRKRYVIKERFKDISMNEKIKNKQLNMVDASNAWGSHEKALKLTKPNYAKVTNRIFKDIQDSSEFKAYDKSEKDLSDFRNSLIDKYGNNFIHNMNSSEQTKFEKLRNNRDTQSTAYWNKRREIIRNSHDEILSAKVKDLGYEDNEENRQRFNRLVHDAGKLSVNDYDLVKWYS